MTDTTTSGLGRFVCVRPKKDGTHRVMMVVPKDLRPSDWPASIRLPEIGHSYGRLSDQKFRNAVIADADRLNRRLDERRRWEAVANCQGRSKNLVELARIYQNSERFRALSPARQTKNLKSLGWILQWSEGRGHPEVASITESTVVDFLDGYSSKPSTRYDLRALWSVLLRMAKAERWIAEIPLQRGGWRIERQSEAILWTEDDVEQYAAMARRMNEPGLAAMLVVMMRTGQRLGDMRTARWMEEYQGGRFVLSQHKTRSKVNIPVPADLQAIIESVRSPYSDAVFPSGRTGQAFGDQEVKARFNEVREALTHEGGRRLTMNMLRHSAVCALIEANVHTMQIAAITGHLLARVHVILERYAPDRPGLAEQGMMKAHISRGGKAEDFASVEQTRLRDTGSGGPAKPYATPATCWKNPTSHIAAILHREHSALNAGDGEDLCEPSPRHAPAASTKAA